MAAKMGYKQELRRQYSTVQIFAVAFSIMGLVPSIASTIAFSLPAGPAGMIWVFLSTRFLHLLEAKWCLGLVHGQHIDLLRWPGHGRYGLCDAHSRRSILVDALLRRAEVEEPA